MKIKYFLILAFFVSFIFLACKDTKKEEAELNQQLEEIKTVEQTIDSTVNDVHQKAKEVEDLIKELDSI